MNTEDTSLLPKEISPILSAFRNNSWKQFTDPDSRTKLVYFFLVLWLLSLVTIPLSRLSTVDGQSPDLFTIADIISYPSFLAFVLSYFFWLAQVTENALLLAPAHRAAFSPLRHLIYYILPVWNLYGPYDGMKTVYEESRKAATGEKKPSLLAVRLWWILVLNAAACPFYLPNARSIYHVIFHFPDTPPMPTLPVLSLVTAFSLAAGFATFLIIRKVTLYQKDVMDELTSLAQGQR